MSVLVVALLASVLLLLAASTAHAASSACGEVTLSQPFARWNDLNHYVLVPGGDFEGSLTGWTLSGGAEKASGSEPYGVTGHVGSWSLRLPSSSTAQSPFICVTSEYPTFRFFARSESSGSGLLIEVLYKSPKGTVMVLSNVTVSPNSTFIPVRPLSTGSTVGGLLTNGTAQMALRFKPVTSNSRIDDVFVDPRMN